MKDSYKQALAWVIEAAKTQQLGIMQVEHKETGEEGVALVILMKDTDEVMDMYPIALITNDVRKFMNTWNPPEGIYEHELDFTRTQDERRQSLDAGDESPQGSET